MERIHAAIGKGGLDDPAMLGSDGRGIKNPTGTEEGQDTSLFYYPWTYSLPCFHIFFSRDHHVDAPFSCAARWRNEIGG
jgi:hypothetical protein